MTTETMTIHEALSELKMLDKRTLDKITNAQYCVANRHVNTKINGKTISEFSEDVKAEYQSIMDLIRRRAAIRNAVSLSNASTIITVAGKDYTVAEAIEMKNTGTQLKRNLLTEMTTSFNRATRNVTSENEGLNRNADSYISSLFGNKDKVNAEDINKSRNLYIEQNTMELVDPLNAKEKIEELSASIETFNHEVDSKLSVSNALTTITISY